MNYLIFCILSVSCIPFMGNLHENQDSTLVGEEWCSYCYKNINNVDSVFYNNILYIKKKLKFKKRYKLDNVRSFNKRKSLKEFLWVVSLMSGKDFIGSNPHEPPLITRRKTKELEQWYYEHKHFISIDILRIFYCSLYPPIMDFQNLEEYYDNLNNYKITD